MSQNNKEELFHFSQSFDSEDFSPKHERLNDDGQEEEVRGESKERVGVDSTPSFFTKEDVENINARETKPTPLKRGMKLCFLATILK